MAEIEGSDITGEIEYDGDIFEKSVYLNIETDKTINEKMCYKAITTKELDQTSDTAQYFGDDDSEFKCGKYDTSEKKKTRKRAKPSTTS